MTSDTKHLIVQSHDEIHPVNSCPSLYSTQGTGVGQTMQFGPRNLFKELKIVMKKKEVDDMY